MKQVSILILAVLLMPCAFAEPVKTKQVVITCKLVHVTATTPRVFKINFLNPFQNSPQSAKLDERNEFCVREEMLFVQNMTIQYNGSFINLYVHPGDSVQLTIDASLLDKPDFEWVTIGGDHAVVSNQVNKCHSYLSKIPSLDYDYSLTPAAMLDAIKKDYERQMGILRKYAAENALAPEVVQWAERDIKYSIGNWMSDYLNIDSISMQEKRARASLFADPFFMIHDPANFQTMMFPYHLSAYASRITYAEPSIRAALMQGRKADGIKKGIAVLLKEPAGICRDYMLHHFISSFTRKMPALLDSLGDTRKYFTQARAYDYLKQVTALVQRTDFPYTVVEGISYLNADTLVEAIPPTDVFNFLAKKYPGKILYIDVYATWCVPCLEELKNVPALHQSYKGRDIVFVNLCLQSTMGKWKKMIKEKNIEGENYFFDEDATKLFMGTYKLNGFPSYLLTGKNGKIYTTNAPRPSEANALQTAISHLEKVL